MMRSALIIVVCSFAAVRAPAQPPADLDQRFRDALPDLVALYKHLHAHPELSLQEEQTALRLA